MKHQKFFIASLSLCSGSVWALPTGHELIAGQAAVSMPTASQMNIDQTSQRAAINWQGFSVAANEAVTIQQPNTNAALLNRVVGQDASQIQGRLNANGQVYLVNPNGVMFSKTAQVDVGGLIATTHNIQTADFMNGKYHFTQDHATGKVENHGTINAKDGGVVALIGEQVTNTGTINTPKGTTALAAGKTVDLDFQGNGLVQVKVSEAALNAQITNHGAIQADGGRVVMNAKAANQLMDTVINQDGIIQANSLVERNGEIILDGGDNGTVKIAGVMKTINANNAKPTTSLQTVTGGIDIQGKTINLENTANLNASGTQQAGNIRIGDKQRTEQVTLKPGSTIAADVTETGNAGKVEIFANMDNGQVHVQGNIHAGAQKQGNGGLIETSAAKVKMLDSANISTAASHGKSGTWLVDPTDFTIAATGGDITGAKLANHLAANNVEIKTLATGDKGSGDIFVKDAITWNTVNSLSLFAHRNIEINEAINATGDGSVKLRADNSGTGTGTVNFSDNGHITVNTGTVDIYYNPVSYTDPATKSDFFSNPYRSKVTLQPILTGRLTSQNQTISLFTTDFSRLGVYMLVNDINQLQAMNTNLLGNYALGKDIDASDTKNLNPHVISISTGNNQPPILIRIGGNFGFVPIGNSQQPFSGNFDGLSHTITELSIKNPNTDDVGLFGNVQGNNFSVTNLTITNSNNNLLIDSLKFSSGSIRNVSLNNIDVLGRTNVGGLAGSITKAKFNNVSSTGKILNYAPNVNVGGLVGNSENSEINDAYAKIDFLSGAFSHANVGGLVGHITGTKLNRVFSEGGDILSGSNVGGLVGQSENSEISDAYATANVFSSANVGGLVGHITETKLNRIFSTGNVMGDSSRDSNVGGLVGNGENSVISDADATGIVIRPDKSPLADGLIGFNANTSIVNASATGGQISLSTTGNFSTITTTDVNATTAPNVVSFNTTTASDGSKLYSLLIKINPTFTNFPNIPTNVTGSIIVNPPNPSFITVNPNGSINFSNLSASGSTAQSFQAPDQNNRSTQKNIDDIKSVFVQNPKTSTTVITTTERNDVTPLKVEPVTNSNPLPSTSSTTPTGGANPIAATGGVSLTSAIRDTGLTTPTGSTRFTTSTGGVSVTSAIRSIGLTSGAAGIILTTASNNGSTTDKCQEDNSCPEVLVIKRKRK